MLSEVVGAFETERHAHLKGSCFVDATVGLAGHAKEFVKKGIFVIGIDTDAESLKIAEDVLKKACLAGMPSGLECPPGWKPAGLEACPVPHRMSGAGCFKLLQGNFYQIDALIRSVFAGPVMGILFDLGISSFQLDDPKRGFSFKDPKCSLDMRLDRENQEVKASDLLALLDRKKLKKLFAEVLPDGLAAIIADKIIKRRLQEPITTTGDLLDVIRPLVRKKSKIDNATLPFLALRMAVNSEKENLVSGLEKAFKILMPGGRIAVISFHSGEDRIVKRFFRLMEAESKAILVTKKPLVPGKSEISFNPRARSAKMRILQKI